jgi:hypothetical protein
MSKNAFHAKIAKSEHAKAAKKHRFSMAILASICIIARKEFF